MSNSTNVETNVVQMRFDNKNFEKNVSQTMDSLDKLKKELDFDESKKSFKSLEENAKKVDFSPLSKGIEKVQASFSFLDTFSATVYHRLSNRLIDIGKKITDSVSTEGMRTGFSQYEEKMNSFKTIQAAASKDFSDAAIDNYLKDLTQYANKTIYSLQDMTTNIGKFTNAGVKLDTAVKAIKGVANEAARSGANAQEASRAMYNFAQSLSVGHMLTIDWKSIENANMATREFKEQLAETGVQLKKLTKVSDGVYKTLDGTTVTVDALRESLSKKWLTSDVLIKTLEKYADTNTEIGKASFEAAQQVNTFHKMMDVLKESLQSNWAGVWETIIGNLKEATELYTKISDTIGGAIDKFFEEKQVVLQTWRDQHGRERVLQAMVAILKNFGEVLRTIRAAWRDIFPKKTANDMLALTVSFENFAKKTKPSRELLIKIRDTFKGVFSAISIVLNAVKAFKATFGKFFIRVLGDALHTIFGVTGSLGDMLVQVRKSVIGNKTFYKAFKSIVDVLEWVYSGFKKVTGIVWDFVKTIGDALKSLGGFNAFKDWFGGLVDAIKNFDLVAIVKSIWKMFKTIGKAIDKAMSATFDFYTPLKNKIIETKDKIVNSKVVQWVIGLFESMVEGIQKAFDKMKDIKTDGADHVVEETKSKFSLLEGIANVFKKVWSVIKGIFDAVWPVIKDVFKSLGTGIQMLWEGVTSNIKKSDLGDAGGFLGGLGIIGLVMAIREFVKEMKPMFDVFKIFSKGGALTSMFNLLGNLSKLVKAKIIKEIAAAILMLVAALFLLCTLPQEKVAAATITMGILFQGLTSVFKSIEGATGDIKDKGDAKQVTTRLFGIAAMIAAIAIAMVVLTIAMKKIAKLSTEDITKGVIVIMLLFRIIERTVTSILTAGQRLRGSKTGDVNIMVKGVAGVIKSLGKAVLLIAAACWVLAKTMEETDKEGNKTLNPKRIVIPLIAIGALIALIGFIITKVTAASKPLIEEGSSHNVSILNGKGGVALTIIALAVFVKQFAKAFLMLMASVALIAVASKFLGWGSLWASFGLMIATIVSVLTAMLIAVKLLTKMSDEFDKEGKGGLLKISVLIGLVSLFITAIAGLMAVLSFLPSNWAWTGASAMLAIAASISMIMLALSAMLKNSFYDLTYDPKGIATIVGSITLAIATLVTAVVVMAKTLAGTDTTKAIMILLGIAAGLTAVIVAVGHFQKFARGFELFTKGLAAFGIAAAGFAAAAALIILTLKQISKMSDSEIAAIGENMKKVTTAILTASDQIIGLIMGLVHTVVGTAIGTAVTTIIDSSKQIITGLLELLDILLENAPTLVNKLLQVAVEILSTFERECAPVIAKLVSTVATIISEVAKAITDNAPKIVNAINDVITAITTVVVGSVAKMLGLDEFKGAVNTLIKIIKPFTAYLLAMFAISKFKKNVSIVTKLLNTVKTRIGLLVKTTKTSGLAAGWKEFLGIRQLNEDWTLAKTAYKEGWASLGEATKVGGAALLKAAGVGAGIGLALGSIVKAFIDAKTDALNATTSWAEDTDSELKELRDTVEKTADELREARKKNKEDIKEVNKEYDTQETMLERLAKLYDPKTGKVLEGHEDEVKSIAEKINTALGVRLELEGKLLNIIDEQGKKRKVDLDYLKELNERERLKATLDKNKELIESYKGEGGKLQLQRTQKSKAEKKKSEYESMKKLLEQYEDKFVGSDSSMDTVEATGDTVVNLLKNFALGKNKELDDSTKKIIEQISETYGDTKLDFSQMLSDINSQISTQEGVITKAENYIKQMEYEIARYEEGVNAALSGTAEQIHNVNLKYLSGYVAKGSGTTFDMTTALKKQMDMLKNMSLNPGDYDKTQMKQYLEGMMKQMTDLGYNKDTKIEGGYKITLKNQFGADEIKNFDTYGDLYAHYLEAFSNMPELMTEEVANGIEAASKDSKINSAVNSFSDSLKEGTTSSFKDGLSENAKGVLSNYISNKDNANGVLGFLRADTDTHSPSKLYAKEIGEPLGEGIITGLSNYIDEAMLNGSVDGLMEKLQSSIFPAIASLTGNSIPFGGVTPVNFGLNQNGSGIYGTDLTVNDTLPYDAHLMNITAILQKHSDNMMNQTNTIIEELGLLRGDVSGLAEHIDSIELRLDGNELVGGITAKMNNSLLRYSNRIGRRQ